jgi:hypothetical protein
MGREEKLGVPFVDLRAQHRGIQQELDQAVRDVIESAAFVLGPAVEGFESDFAQYLGVQHAVGTSNGTTALQLALLALGVGEGDEVIVPAQTFIATAEAVAHVGAQPVFVDVLESTACMDPAALASAVTPRTRAIVPVHLFGQAAELDSIQAKLQRLPEPPARVRLHKDDYLGALGVLILVFLSTLPIVFPFLLFHDTVRALRFSNGIAIALLFIMGYRLGKYSDSRPWITGFGMMGIGVGLVIITMALGG